MERAFPGADVERVTRLPASLLALLAGLLILPSGASADPPGGEHRGPWGGGGSARTLPEISPAGDPTGGAAAAQTPATVPPATGTGTGGGAGADDAGAWPAEDDERTVAPGPDPALLVPVPSSRRTVKGRVARIRTDGRAAIPRSAPKAVKRVLAAANLIVGKPYKWGGGHAKLRDSGYDCSGAVGYALIRAGLLDGSMVSGTFARWARAGAGRWISIHANAGHVYMEVAGLRLDTSAVADPGGAKGVRWRPVIGRRTGFRTRHVAGL